MKFPRILKLRLPWIGALYLTGYALLDKVSYIHPFGASGITPWNPSTGLSFLLVLLYGRQTLPLLFVAPALADIMVRGPAFPLWVTGASALIAGGGYALATLFLLHPRIHFDRQPSSLRGLIILMGTAVVCSALVASAYVLLLIGAGTMPVTDFAPAALRYWVGDMIGIAVVTPFGLLALSRERLIGLNWETVLHALAIALVLGIAVGSARDQQLPLFYLLFLPLTWVAVSSGLEGVSVALVVTQIGLLGALQFAPEQMKDITNLQARMLVLAVTGLAAGAAVTERRHTEEQLRQNQAAVARLSRLGSMGELAAAIAHEVNQPLSAAGTYSRLVTDSLEREKLSDPGIVQTAQKATAQVERAAAVIRRLRALVRTGRNDMSEVDIAKVVQEALDLVGPVLERSSICVDVEVEKGLPPVMADRIQIEQVLVNLLRNSAEAIAGVPGHTGHISLRAARIDAEHVEIRVADTGPGFPQEFCGTVPPIFSSSKADGLGVGLSLCRSIAEAHGGTIRVSSNRNGAEVSFSLRLARGMET